MDETELYVMCVVWVYVFAMTLSSMWSWARREPDTLIDGWPDEVLIARRKMGLPFHPGDHRFKPTTSDEHRRSYDPGAGH